LLTIQDEEIKSTKSLYYIQSDNIGYKLLQRSGWKGEGGLGKSGQGMNYPISVDTPRGPPVLGIVDFKKNIIDQETNFQELEILRQSERRKGLFHLFKEKLSIIIKLEI
jgi:hypothetical protein